MFRLQPQPTFELKVSLHVPGTTSTTLLELVAKALPRRELKAWMAGAKERTDPEFLGDVIVGWGPGVVGENDQAVPFTPEAFATLLDNWPSASREIYTAYLSELTEAAAKN